MQNILLLLVLRVLEHLHYISPLYHARHKATLSCSTSIIQWRNPIRIRRSTSGEAFRFGHSNTQLVLRQDLPETAVLAEPTTMISGSNVRVSLQ
jgi:hypothetical protein